MKIQFILQVYKTKTNKICFHSSILLFKRICKAQRNESKKYSNNNIAAHVHRSKIFQMIFLSRYWPIIIIWMISFNDFWLNVSGVNFIFSIRRVDAQERRISFDGSFILVRLILSQFPFLIFSLLFILFVSYVKWRKKTKEMSIKLPVYSSVDREDSSYIFVQKKAELTHIARPIHAALSYNEEF